MRAIITVVGRDTVGILAKVSAMCAEHNVNIIEVTQSILQDMFCMIMLADVTKCNVPFTSRTDRNRFGGRGRGTRQRNESFRQRHARGYF